MRSQRSLISTVAMAARGRSKDGRQIRDRLSFLRFLGLGLGDPVPDAKTIWLFREQLTRAGAIDVGDKDL